MTMTTIPAINLKVGDTFTFVHRVPLDFTVEYTRRDETGLWVSYLKSNGGRDAHHFNADETVLLRS